MDLEDFNERLSEELSACCGFSRDLAAAYTSHGGRADAATTLKRAWVDPDEINALVGVSSRDWHVGYDRGDLDRRFATSRSLGF
mmetsp:Transcript_24480/g.82443  ORF Transcript_24480/g.82443 Transcript_24480/m.82443 type:complete len:84 (+) Transcript_24480:2484-2735(+)